MKEWKVKFWRFPDPLIFVLGSGFGYSLKQKSEICNCPFSGYGVGNPDPVNNEANPHLKVSDP